MQGGRRAAWEKFPCRGGESIRRRSTSTLSNLRLDIPYSSLSLPVRSLFLRRLWFERIIIRGTRTQGPSSRGPATSLPFYSQFSSLYLPLSPFISSLSSLRYPRWSTWLLGSLILGRKLGLPRASARFLHGLDPMPEEPRCSITIRFSC